MAVLSGVERLSLLVRLLIFSFMKGALIDVSATVVFGMNNTSALFECSESVTLRCNAGVSFANWQIAYRLESGTSSSAQCYGNECYVQNNFTGRYIFTYSSITGIADLHINPVVIEDDGREYKCNDGTQSPLKATVKLLQSTKTVAGSGLSDSAIIAMCVAIPGSVIAVLIVVIFVVRCIRQRRIKASDAPGTPVGFELVRESVTEVSATFRCMPNPYQPGKQEIVLFCQQANNGTHTSDNSQIIDDAGARAITLRINNLRQGCVYDCSVFARNKNIRSANSEKIRIRTLGLPDAPTDFRVVKVKQDCIILSWIPGHYRMNQQSFVLELMNTKNGDITLEPIRMDNVIPLMHTVEGLPEGTTFIINLRAKNDVGDSDNVGPLEVTTTGNPEPPSEFKEAGVTSSSITISWRPGTYRRQTQYFVIEYGRKKKQLKNIEWKQKKKVDDGQTVMNFTLNKLKSGTAYVVVIFARNDIGESARTLPLPVNTKEENVEHIH